MASFDGGDGSVLTGDPEDSAATAAAAEEERSQDSVSNSQGCAEDEGRGQKRVYFGAMG